MGVSTTTTNNHHNATASPSSSMGSSGAAAASLGKGSHHPRVVASPRKDRLLRHMWEWRMVYSVVGFVVAILLAIVWHRHSLFTQLLHYEQVLFPHQPGPCYNIPGVVHGAEDIEQFTPGIVFISTGLRFNLDPDTPPWKDRQGQILIFDFNQPVKGALPLMIEGKLNRKTFNPHGIGSWANPDGSFSLFVVNHLEGESVVERFSFDLQRLNIIKHEETYRSHSFHLLSDVAATGPRSFYYTNSFRCRDGGLLQQIELQFATSFGSIGHCMRHACGKVVGSLRIPSGIAMSPDKRLVYLTSIGTETISVYERGEHHDLNEKQVWQMETTVNNINVDPETGDLWTGGTPVFYRSLQHAHDPAIPCPSQVLQLKVRDGKIIKMREVYSEDGNRFVSLSTSALFFNKRLLIGSAFSKAAMCEVLYAW